MAVSEMGGDHGRILRTNDALCRMLDRPAAVMRRYSFSDFIHPEDIGTLLSTSPEGGYAEVRLGRRDGTYLWVSLRNSVVADASDGPRLLLTHIEDIDDRKRRELDLAHRASHDALTDLPNAAELHARDDDADRAETAHRHIWVPVADNPHGLAVLFFALRDFKALNTHFGYDAGDSVLIEVARRLRQAAREGDTVARYGVDEFVVLAAELAPADA